ncbi:MAG: NFACT RNA binding domain-containing protein [Candidatus Methylomirabilales bacterium]
MMLEWTATQARYARLLRRRITRVERRRDKILADVAQARGWEQVRRQGELLRVNQRRVPRGLPEVTLPDYYGEPGKSLTIPLDPALSVEANAERYFRQARKAKRGLPIMERRLAQTETELKAWETALERVIQVETAEALDRVAAAHDLARLEPSSPPPRPRKSKQGGGLEPRRYVSTDGREIWVGRSSVGNEHLTFHLARPHDLWLHVEGYGGSHVVVRNRKGQTVPPRTLREAAQLAAFFSKARNAGKVPIHYTAARYVRRVKGRKPGTVLLTQEKTVLVTPDPAVVAACAERGKTGLASTSR